MTTGIEAALIGRVGQDPTLRTSAAGKPWLAVSVAVDNGESPQWVSVAIFGGRAVELSESLKKGDKLYVEGRLSLRTWTKDGEQKTGLNVAAWKTELLNQIGRRKPKRTDARGNEDAPGREVEQRAPTHDDAIPF